MRLSTKNEWIVVGLISMYVAFVPQLQMARDFMSTSIGRLVAMASVVFTWKYVSELVAVLLAIVYVRCMLSSWEGFAVPPAVPVTPTVPVVPTTVTAPTVGTAAPAVSVAPPNPSPTPITVPGAGTMPPVTQPMVPITGPVPNAGVAPTYTPV
jgi:hypothetical protein